MIAAAAAGEIDHDFWRSFFRYQSGSGPSELTGWILTLFPYLVSDWETKALAPNTYLSTWHDRLQTATRRGVRFRDFDKIQGPSIGEIPEGLVSAPVRFDDRFSGAKIELRFVAGLFGVEQDVETRALSASFGWAIVYE